MNEKKLTSVTKEAFQEFVKNYPKTLSLNICNTCEPLLISYNDFDLGNWPKSIVASCHAKDEFRPEDGWRILK